MSKIQWSNVISCHACRKERQPIKGCWSTHNRQFAGRGPGNASIGGSAFVENSPELGTTGSCTPPAATTVGEWHFLLEPLLVVPQFPWRQKKSLCPDEWLSAVQGPLPRWALHFNRPSCRGAQKEGCLPCEKPRLTTWQVDSWVASSRGQRWLPVRKASGSQT